MAGGHILLTAHCSEKLMGDLHMSPGQAAEIFSATVEQTVLQSLLDGSPTDEREPTI